MSSCGGLMCLGKPYLSMNTTVKTQQHALPRLCKTEIQILLL